MTKIPSKPPAPVGLCELRNLEVRDAGSDESGVEYWEFEGHAAVFDSRSENLGGFVETIKRGAFKDVLDNDVRFLIDHVSRFVLARGKNLELTEDPTGLKVKAKIRKDLSYGEDFRVNLEEGNITQMSFAFGSDVDDDWTEEDDGVLLRTIKRFKSLFDVSGVTYPAYPATDAGVRAINRLARGEEVTDEERAAVQALISNSPSPDAEVRDDGATVQEPVEEVAASVERAEGEGDDPGAGMSAVAAGRRVELLAKQAQL